MRIALAGNPNSGKTTMFNALTGRNEKVGNWAGVTVDTKEAPIKKGFAGDKKLVAVDLPGAYSMSPFTREESITRDYIQKEAPQVIINIVDATNLSRSLFFTTQLLELGIPVVVALNKKDLNEKRNTRIDTQLLSRKLGCPVLDTVSIASRGLQAVVAAAVAQANTPQNAPFTQKASAFADRHSAEIADRERFAFVDSLVRAVEVRQVLTIQKQFGDKLDSVLTSRWLGIPIFAAVIFLVFQVSQVWVGTPISEWLVGWLEAFQEWVRTLFADADPLLTAILVDGVIGGVVAVVGFLPLVMVMYFLIALLEDCGYMSRAAVVLDPIFQRVGLSGKSVIPFVITVGCAVPGIMASRTIRNERERRSAAMLAPFMPCGAKIPVIALFAGAFFDDAGWVSTLMYLSGILLIFLGALLVTRIAGARTRKAFFIIELPEYKTPSLWNAFKSMCSRGWAYIVKAATVILLCNMAIQLMQSFHWNLRVAESADQSILSTIATPFAYVLAPIVGVVSWQLAAAAVTGFIAKENVVGTLAVCFVGLQNLIDKEELAVLEGAGAEVAGILAISKVAALAYLMFNLFTPPCFAAIGAMNAEMKSKKWLWGGIGLQFAAGYTVSYLVYTFGTLIMGESLNIGMALGGLILVLAMVSAITVLAVKGKK